jgi:hypothetical protein
MQETTHFGDNYDPFKEYEFPPALGAVSTRSNNYSFIPPFDKLVFVSDDAISTSSFSNLSQAKYDYAYFSKPTQYKGHVQLLSAPLNNVLPYSVVIINPWALKLSASAVYGLLLSFFQGGSPDIRVSSYTGTIDLMGYSQSQISASTYVSRTRAINNISYKGKTTYMGKRKSRTQTTVYDKGAEQKVDFTWTRIERKVKIQKDSRPSAQQFLTGGYKVEPFKPVHIVDISKLKKSTRIGKAVHQNGIGKAILDRSLSESERKWLRKFAKDPANQLIDINGLFLSMYSAWIAPQLAVSLQVGRK